MNQFLQTVDLRDACEADFDAIRRIHQTTFDEHVAREAAFDADAPFIDQLLSGEDPDCFGFARTYVRVAGVGGEVAGYVVYKTIKIWGLAANCIVHDISVSPEFRRTGLARMLLQDMEYREPRTATFLANIWPGNAASKALFEHLGYVLSPDSSRPYHNAFKFQPVPFWNKPATLLTPFGVLLYVGLLYAVEIAVLRLRTIRT